MMTDHEYLVQALERALSHTPWTDHPGDGDPPPETADFLQVRFRDGDTGLGIRWDWDQNWSWSDVHHDGDIVAYRAIPAQTTMARSGLTTPTPPHRGTP